MEYFKKSLVELLSIQGVSGNEKNVARYVTSKLAENQFLVQVDNYGNVLAERSFGIGSVILLSAHMDTVDSFAPERKLLWQGDMLRSSEGILGADDRAGIAIILEVIRRINMGEEFNGTIKVAFTCEEEIGRVGSSQISREWLHGVDTAIVADRRNRRDIVTSCRWMAFCPEEIGLFWEQVGKQIGVTDWKACQGGISDAVTYAQHGLPSVNLSCGYKYEHTDFEELHVPSALDTVDLIVGGIKGWSLVTDVVRCL
ncbi:M20/M25/M40 family metallo-hydrolase [Paenibacillus cremeus]|uniref:M20/M25/M40 family metallo-hydrolase n=1 Tax=Paenibacillus cremeus TaxID=2163881 RepID=A0A559K8B3_9BACL|nr:M20/M25/M40 family metallo-hydrolase [Paenibacillus cremeus]TVY08370.1 M20/M25/M40 family metallo-hydrolase [Paenibacillus cremeus]